MVFRRIDGEYPKEPAGLVVPYPNGYVIDVENNVYREEFGDYIKVGYDIPGLDEYVQAFPIIDKEVAMLNIFAPQKRGLEGVLSVFAYVYVRLAMKVARWRELKCYEFISKHFAKKLLVWTEGRKQFRLFLPVVWFYDTDDDQLKSLAIDVVMFPLYVLGLLLFLFIFAFAILFNTSGNGGNPLAIFALICAGVQLVDVFSRRVGFMENYKLAKKLEIDKF